MRFDRASGDRRLRPTIALKSGRFDQRGLLLVDLPWLDLSGFGMFIHSMQDAARAAYPGAELGLQIGFVGLLPGTSEETMKLFHWGGIEWSFAMVPLRLLWIGVAMSLTAAATLFFDRFDPASASRVRPSRRKRRVLPAAEDSRSHSQTLAGWTDVDPVEFNFSFLRMWRAELKLMVKGYHWSWYLIAIGLIVVQLTVPYEYARTFAMSAAWIWPLAMWSSMGTREARFNTGQLVFSSPYAERRQFPAMWLAGLTVAMVTGSGMIVRALLTGEVGHLSALLVGALFIPTLALLLGTVSGTKKLFEVSYLVIWYLGPVNHVTAFDFLGATDTSVTGAIPQAYFITSLVLVIGAFLFRQRQMNSGMA